VKHGSLFTLVHLKQDPNGGAHSLPPGTRLLGWLAVMARSSLARSIVGRLEERGTPPFTASDLAEPQLRGLFSESILALISPG